MSRYIDADKFEVFHYEKTEGKENTFDAGVQFVLEKIDEAPTEDVAPVHHAKWIPVTNSRGGHECSLCHYYAPSFKTGDEWLSDYCPNCGAKMDKEKT